MWRRHLPATAAAAAGSDASAPIASVEKAQRCPESPLAAYCTHPRNGRATAATVGSKHTHIQVTGELCCTFHLDLLLISRD